MLVISVDCEHRTGLEHIALAINHVTQVGHAVMYILLQTLNDIMTLVYINVCLSKLIFNFPLRRLKINHMTGCKLSVYS